MERVRKTASLFLRPSPGLLWIIGIAASMACDSETPTLPPDADTVLKSSELLSGGEGTLISDGFREIGLVSERDSTGRIVEHRWTNFRVLAGADTLDSWRVSDRQIDFRVPVTLAQETEIRVSGSHLRPAVIPARVIGAHRPFYAETCRTTQGLHANTIELVPVSRHEIAIAAQYCKQGQWARGFARVVPASSEPLRWLPGFHFTSDDPDGEFRMWAPGPSYRAGHTVVERPLRPRGSPGLSETWTWRLGSTPEPLNQLACQPDPETLFTATETAPGTCLAFGWRNDDSWRLFRNGSEVLELPVGEDTRGLPVFRVAATGMAVVTRITPPPDGSWPILDADGSVLGAVGGYRVVSSAAFSASGDTLFVLAKLWGDPSNPSEGDLVLDALASNTGLLLARASLASDPTTTVPHPDLALDGDRLWLLLPHGREGVRWTWRVELRDPADLTLDRYLLFPEHPVAGSFPIEAHLGVAPAILPEGTGTRAYAVGNSSLAVAVYLIDFS